MNLAHVLDLKRPLVVFDLETTSEMPETARIVQIGLEIHRPDAEPKAWKTFVNPGCAIPAEAIAVHGITDAMVADAPAFRDMAPKLFPGFDGADVAGFNCKRFDVPVLAAEFKRAGYEWTTEGRVIVDVFRLWQCLRARSLGDALREWTGRDPVAEGGAHDAATDVDWTRHVLHEMVIQHQTKCGDLAKLEALLWPVDPTAVDKAGKFKMRGGEAIITFGNNRGATLRAMAADTKPRGMRNYLEWIAGPKSDFAVDTKQVARDALAGRFPQQERDRPV